MPYSTYVLKNLVAFVPARKKHFICDLCGFKAKRDEMREHLEVLHNLTVEAGGYVFYKVGAGTIE